MRSRMTQQNSSVSSCECAITSHCSWLQMVSFHLSTKAHTLARQHIAGCERRMTWGVHSSAASTSAAAVEDYADIHGTAQGEFRTSRNLPERLYVKAFRRMRIIQHRLAHIAFAHQAAMRANVTSRRPASGSCGEKRPSCTLLIFPGSA